LYNKFKNFSFITIFLIIIATNLLLELKLQILIYLNFFYYIKKFIQNYLKKDKT